jgi:uncharacterized protein
LSLFHQLQRCALADAGAAGLELRDLEMGLSCAYASVEGPEGEAVGVALTPKEEGPASPLRGETLREVIEAGSGYDPYARTAALAVMNAVSRYALAPEPLYPDLRRMLCQKVLEGTQPGDRIAVIGNLRPLVACLKEADREVVVFCRGHRDPDNGIYSDIFEYESVPEADALIITGAALIGSTVDALLALSPRAKMRILAGFTAGVHPDWLESSGVTHVAGLSLDPSVRTPLIRNGWASLFDYPAYWLEV